jgi:hypothetical protein
MKPINRYFLVFLIALVSHRSFSQTANTPVNYLNTPAAISFNNMSFQLAWSSHPSAAYYKQEYLPKGETLNKFTNMLLLEVLVSPTTIKEAIGAKIAELKQMKATNPYVSYDSSYNAAKNEYILDFVLTANTPDGKGISIAERNVYRYKKYSGKNGETGVVLFGVSKRSYGAEAGKFVKGVGVKKEELVKVVREFEVGVVEVKR